MFSLVVLSLFLSLSPSFSLFLSSIVRSALLQLATHNKSAHLLLFSSNWCSSHPNDTAATRLESMAPPRGSRQEKAKVEETVNYWLNRLVPMLRSDHPCFFVCADRTGTEPACLLGKGEGGGEVQFVGCSCVVDLRGVKLEGRLGMHEQELLIVDLDLREKMKD